MGIDVKQLDPGADGQVLATNGIVPGWATRPTYSLSRVASNLTKTDDTTLTAITGLSFSAAASTTYSFQLVIIGDGGTVEGFGFDFGGGTATFSNFRAHAVLLWNTTNVVSEFVTSAASLISFGSTSFDNYVQVNGTFTTSGAGTVVPRWATQSNSNGSTSTIYAGSHFIVYP